MDKAKQNNQFLKIDVEGKDSKIWESLKTKLIVTVNALLDTTIDSKTGQSLKDEAKDFTSALIDHGKSKLKKTGIDNSKTIAEIEKLYVDKQRQIAETRKINAEAQSIEIDNVIKSLKLSLTVTKALFVNSKEDKDIVFLKNVESFINALNSQKKEID